MCSSNWTTNGTVHCILSLPSLILGIARQMKWETKWYKVFENFQPSSFIQMKWETKWYKFVKESMPLDFFDRYNNQGKTPQETLQNTNILSRRLLNSLPKPLRRVHCLQHS
ncbi:Ankyrin-repeat containing-like protein [Melia azedarach]|uniref:Ankyrin-repeat containing-like protein n=1 Tax=Melia azedarach TaxID=155640 RepID=A0ACC1YWL7_MELAZ|nr:Ankyrin-repeat containing-like protein [Melia azedarach]